MWPFTDKESALETEVDWSKPSIYDETTNQTKLIVPKKHGSAKNEDDPAFSSKSTLVLTKRKFEEWEL
ncbi:hypothetical protein RHGRI_030776 [Rhododendron griersonianum]|uniref:Uncharacterized protein n=1 Tax=Rhododendron griersonianum TaxID=479676 RepID=A0AAV6I5N4_9ERIC|nr:hypothetical protein RHGRI_030776 [Rhododendron griersonianum]